MLSYYYFYYEIFKPYLEFTGVDMLKWKVPVVHSTEKPSILPVVRIGDGQVRHERTYIGILTHLGVRQWRQSVYTYLRGVVIDIIDAHY